MTRMGTTTPEGDEDDEAERRNSLERTLQPPWGRLDWLALVGLSAAALGVFLAVLRFYGEALVTLSVCARYFESDGWRVISDMIDFSSDHSRVTLHPLILVIAMPFTHLLIRFFGVSRIGAVWSLNGIVATVFIGLLYVTQRNLGCPRLGSILVCLLTLASSSFLFWMPVPETYPLGALSLLVCFAVAAVATRRPVPFLAILAAGLFSVGVTITNWMAGLAVAALFKPRRIAVATVVLTLAVLMGVQAVQKMVLPLPPSFFLKPRVLQSETTFVFHPNSGGSKERLRGELLCPVVMPPIRQDQKLRTGRALSVQGFADILGSPAGSAAALSWMVLLGFGLVALVRGPAPPRFRLLLGSVLAGQVVLHLIYGEETFLYALHFLPILSLTVSMATLTRRRRLVEFLLATTILLVLWNNLHRLHEAAGVPLDAYSQDPRFPVLEGPIPQNMLLNLGIDAPQGDGAR